MNKLKAALVGGLSLTLINLPQGIKYTITVTAIGYGSLKSKILTKVISAPKSR